MTRKTTDNPNLQAMIGIEQLLDPLTDAGKAQVLRWVNDEYAHVLAGGRPARAYTATELDRGIDTDDLAARDGRPAGVEP